MLTQFNKEDFAVFFQSVLETALWSSVDQQYNKMQIARRAGYCVSTLLEDVTNRYCCVKDTALGTSEWKISAERVQPTRYAYVEEAWAAAFEKCDDKRGVDAGLDKHFTWRQINSATIEVMKAHALSFWYRTWYYLEHESTVTRDHHDTCRKLGYNFQLACVGSGVSFLDGDWPIYGEMFDRIAKCYPGCDLLASNMTP